MGYLSLIMLYYMLTDKSEDIPANFAEKVLEL